MPSIADALGELNDKIMTQEEFFYQCIDIIEHWLNGKRKISDLREVTDNLYNEVTKPHWISVEDELPKERDWYLIYDTNMGHDVCMWYGDCWGNCYKVTHWMPLPSIEHFADVSKKISSSEKPNNCKKFDMKGYENVVIHEGNAKGGIMKGGEQ